LIQYRTAAKLTADVNPQTLAGSESASGYRVNRALGMKRFVIAASCAGLML